MNEQLTVNVDRAKWYRTELPNIADDELDPYQYRLYAHYKRVCGDSGSCWESIDTLAAKCRMSRDKVIECHNWLAGNGWIQVASKTMMPQDAVSLLKSKTPQRMTNCQYATYRCSWCKCSTVKLHAHHYPIPRCKGGVETLDICANCHIEYHALTSPAYQVVFFMEDSQ